MLAKLSLGVFVIPFLFTTALIAQKVDYNTIILPDNATNVSVEERLVRLAWQNNPENAILNNNIEIAERQVKLNSASWLNDIRISGNLNETVLNDLNDNQDNGNINQFYPMYNVSASIPLGIFVTNPQRVKMAQLNYANQQQQVNQQKLRIRAMVLRSYQSFEVSRELLGNQTEITENAYNTYSLIEERFKSGEATLEEFNEAFNSYKNELAARMKASHNYEIAKINLEELLGVKLEYLGFITL